MTDRCVEELDSWRVVGVALLVSLSILGCGLVARDQEGRFVFYRHADANVSLLLTLAGEIVSGTASNLLECPHCGIAC